MAELGRGVFSQEDQACWSVGLRLHGRDRIAEYDEVDALVGSCVCGECRHAGEAAPGRETDQPHLSDPVLSQPPDLGLEGMQWHWMLHSQGVSEHAGLEAQTLEPLDNRHALMSSVLCVAAAGQHDHLRHAVCRRASVRAIASTVALAARDCIARTCHSSSAAGHGARMWSRSLGHAMTERHRAPILV